MSALFLWDFFKILVWLVLSIHPSKFYLEQLYICMYLFEIESTSAVDLCAQENLETLAYLTLRACPKPSDMPFETTRDRCL